MASPRAEKLYIIWYTDTIDLWFVPSVIFTASPQVWAKINVERFRFLLKQGEDANFFDQAKEVFGSTLSFGFFPVRVTPESNSKKWPSVCGTTTMDQNLREMLWNAFVAFQGKEDDLIKEIERLGKLLESKK